MSEVVERVTRALRAENAAIVKEFGSGRCPVEVAYTRFARAAILALREPTEGMLRAGAAGYGEASVADFEEDAIRMAWHAAIDAALSEGTAT